MRANVLRALAAFCGAAILCANAFGQDFPNRRITFIVALPPGASADGLARMVGEKLSPRLGQPVIVENKPGASGFIGSDFVAQAAPDGYTMLLTTQSLTAPKEQYAIKTFDPAKLAALGRLASFPFIVVASAETSAKTLQDFVNQARANPGKLDYGVVPNGAMQLDMLQFKSLLKMDIAEVPFNGATPIATALLGNQIQMGFLGVSAIAHIQSGKLRGLAVTSRSRWPRLPELPSMTELGLDFESGAWYGAAVPSATPQHIRDRLTRELLEVMRRSDVKDAVVKLGLDPLEPSPDEMNQQIRREKAQNEAAFRLLNPR